MFVYTLDVQATAQISSINHTKVHNEEKHYSTMHCLINAEMDILWQTQNMIVATSLSKNILGQTQHMIVAAILR